MSLTAQPSTTMQQQGALYQVFSFISKEQYQKFPPLILAGQKKKPPEIIRPPVFLRYVLRAQRSHNQKLMQAQTQVQVIEVIEEVGIEQMGPINIAVGSMPCVCFVCAGLFFSI